MRPDRLARFEHLFESGQLVRDLNESDDNKWQHCFNSLIHYKEQYGNCSVPTNYEVPLPDGRTGRLGPWLTLQKQLFRARKLKTDRMVSALTFII